LAWREYGIEPVFINHLFQLNVPLCQCFFYAMKFLLSIFKILINKNVSVYDTVSTGHGEKVHPWKEGYNYTLVVYGKGRVNARKVCMVCEIVQVNMSCQHLQF
jgi:hypothetical protein